MFRFTDNRTEEVMAEQLSAHIALDRRRVVGHISPTLFGGFIEHMGRCVYEGIYDPGSPHADAKGIRLDVLGALNQMGVTIMRYPGGNMLSGYDWRDGVGPVSQRPRKRELAWKSFETNHFGTHEFLDYCARLGAEPMLGVNLGTGDIALASAYVEYVNAPSGSYWADKRVANGQADPWGVKWWCLGNEMDGPWQIGHLDAVDYGKKALEAAKMMKWQDETIKLVLAGSSSSGMATYPNWDRTILEHCYDHVDVLSMHYYAGNRNDDTPSYLAIARGLEDYVDTLASTIRYVKAVKRSKKTVKLSWDEWNVWYKNMQMDGKWTVAPHLIEEVYNLEDALVVGQWLNVFLRKCDVIEAACLAQMVNVIAPILTTKDAMLIQSIFYPFMMMAKRAVGSSLDAVVQAPVYSTKTEADVPMIDVSASWDESTNRGACFVVNRSLDQAMTVTIRFDDGMAPVKATAAESLWGTDPKSHNTFAQPQLLTSKSLATPIMQDGVIIVTVPPLSTTAIDLHA
jgi:alpha-N-arabinofuranosidase